MNDFEKKRSEIIDTALNTIGKSANFYKRYLNDDKLSTSLAELHTHVEEYCKLDIQFKAFDKAVQKTEIIFKDLENTCNSSVEEKFKEIYEKENIIINDDIISRHEFMKKYVRDCEDLEVETEIENPEDDIVTTNSFTPPVDPITKSTIRNPVRNTQCGHVYENESIRALISKKSTRCPYIGCPAIQYIQLANLQPDNQLKKRIDRHFLNN